MKVLRLPVGQMAANCYLAIDEQSGDTVIIDPGDDAEFIISTVQREDIAPKAIVATHGHFDHTMAALELVLAFNVPFYMHEADEFLLDRQEDTAIKFVGFDAGPPPDVDFYLEDSSKIAFGGMEFNIMHTPGHTPGSVCLYCPKQNLVFVGDLIFADGYVGRTDFSYSNKTDLLNSINKIHGMPEGTAIYSGHGEEFTLNKNSYQ